MFCNNIFIVENILIGTFLYCCWNKEKKKSFLKRFKCCISCSGTRICSTVCYHDSFGVITKELWQFTNVTEKRPYTTHFHNFWTISSCAVCAVVSANMIWCIMYSQAQCKLYVYSDAMLKKTKTFGTWHVLHIFCICMLTDFKILIFIK